MLKKTVSVSGVLLVILFTLITIKPAFSERNDRRNRNEPVIRASLIETENTGSFIHQIYDKIGLTSKGLSFETFHKAYNGYVKLNGKGFIKNAILTIADMSQPSCKKRLYIIDMTNSRLLINTLVAHGRNSGEAQAARFSNTPESLQSSLGFYITGNTYEGNNGYSLRLKGMERGFNDQAENRAIVMHGAPYVNEDIAKKTGRIGRSWGCPAVSVKEHQQIINLVKNGSCLFVFAPEKQYLVKSALSNDAMGSGLL